MADEIGNETGAGDLCEPGPDVDDTELARIVARQEIASLAGLWLRRLQETSVSSPTGEGQAALMALSSIWGEALRDFSASESEPGE